MTSVIPFKQIVLWLILLGLLTACGGSAERKAKYMEEGKHLLAAGDYQKAQLSFKNVLQIDPKDPEARYQMAEALSKLGEIQAAVSQYLTVISEDPKHLMSRLRMGQVYLLVNKPDDAEKMAKEVQAIDPEHTEGRVLMAGVLATKNQTDAAIAQLDAVLKKQPDDVQANLLLASLNAKAGKIDQAIRIAQTNRDKNPTSTAPLLMLTKLYMDSKDLDKAEQSLQALITLEPKQLEHRKRLAAFLLANNQLDKAEAVLRQGVKDLPEDVAAKGTLISFLVSKRTPETAIAELQPMIEQNPDQYDLRFLLAELELAQKQLDKAEATLKTIVERDKQGPQSLKARNKLARLYIARQRPDEAKALVAQIITENPRDSDALSLRGEFAMTERQLPEAIGDFRAVLVDQPQNIKVLKLLSTAYLLNNDPVLARENMEKVVQLAPTDENAHLELAHLLLQSGDAERALTPINAALKINPNSRRGLEAAFKVHLAQKHWGQAQETAQQLQTAFAKEGIGYFLSGLAYQAEGKIEQSLAAFDKALAQQPESVEPLTQLTKSYLALKQPDKAIAKLTATVKQQPKNFIAYNLLGGVYLSEKHYPEAMAQFKKAQTIKPDWPVAYRMIALTYGAQGNKADAIKTYQDGIAKTNSAVDLVNDLVSLYHNDGDHDKALGVFEAVYQQHPSSMDALNNLASYLSDYAKDAADLERAAQLAEPLSRQTNPNMLDTVGWIAYKQGHYDKAQPLLEKVISLAPEAAISHYHLGMIYFKQNQAAKAREHLQKALAKDSQFIGAEEAKATLKAIEGAA